MCNAILFWEKVGGNYLLTIYVAMTIPVEQPAWYISFSHGRKMLVHLMCSNFSLFHEFTFA
jgi:hypothetical protein